MSIGDIMDVVKEIGCKQVTLTGGEPLIHKDTSILLEELAGAGFEVNVETNGTIIPTIRRDNIFYTVDYKTGASGENSKMDVDVFRSLGDNDVIKCVVGSSEDLEQSLEYLKNIEMVDFKNIFISPVFGSIEPEVLVDFVKQNKLWNWRVQLQIHKIIWNPQERGV
jgi:7-carboxy-7-deazaguanine synthase